MTGQQLKQKLADMGYTNINELAKTLGQSNQKLYASMASPDIKTGLIEDIANALGLRAGDFFPDAGSYACASENSIAVNGNGNEVSSISERFIGLLEKKDEQIDRLLGIIETK